MFSLEKSIDGEAFTQFFHGTLPDVRQYRNVRDVPVKSYYFDKRGVAARFVRFMPMECYGNFAGLNYFKVNFKI